MAAHVHRQCLVRQGLAHAQVRCHVDQVALAGRQVDYRFRFQLISVGRETERERESEYMESGLVRYLLPTFAASRDTE